MIAHHKEPVAHGLVGIELRPVGPQHRKNVLQDIFRNVRRLHHLTDIGVYRSAVLVIKAFKGAMTAPYEFSDKLLLVPGHWVKVEYTRQSVMLGNHYLINKKKARRLPGFS